MARRIDHPDCVEFNCLENKEVKKLREILGMYARRVYNPLRTPEIYNFKGYTLSVDCGDDNYYSSLRVYTDEEKVLLEPVQLGLSVTEHYENSGRALRLIFPNTELTDLVEDVDVSDVVRRVNVL
ncbi:MAG: hypothetical protein AABW52_03685 [Nanoarchaeota archaeon]